MLHLYNVQASVSTFFRLTDSFLIRSFSQNTVSSIETCTQTLCDLSQPRLVCTPSTAATSFSFWRNTTHAPVLTQLSGPMTAESIRGHEWPRSCRSDTFGIDLAVGSLCGIWPYSNMRCSLDYVVRLSAHGEQLACLHNASSHQMLAGLFSPTSVPQPCQHLFLPAPGTVARNLVNKLEPSLPRRRTLSLGSSCTHYARCAQDKGPLIPKCSIHGSTLGQYDSSDLSPAMDRTASFRECLPPRQ